MASRICRLILRSLLLSFFICQASGTRVPLTDTSTSRYDDFRVVYYALPSNTPTILYGGPATFGVNLKRSEAVESTVRHVVPQEGCTDIVNGDAVQDKIAIVQRGSCQFAEKALNIQKTGALGAIVIDYNRGLSTQGLPGFVMGSGTVTETITIPLVFLYSTEGEQLLNASSLYPNLIVGISGKIPSSVPITEELVTETSTTEEPVAENNDWQAFSVSPEEQQQQLKKTDAGQENATQLSTLHISLISAGILLVLILLAVSLGCWYRSTREKSGASPDEFHFSRLKA